ncbi:MAG: hypothetical protein ACRCV9_03615 [Burkholderiaceae bacterium]
MGELAEMVESVSEHQEYVPDDSIAASTAFMAIKPQVLSLERAMAKNAWGDVKQIAHALALQAQQLETLALLIDGRRRA